MLLESRENTKKSKYIVNSILKRLIGDIPYYNSLAEKELLSTNSTFLNKFYLLVVNNI